MFFFKKCMYVQWLSWILRSSLGFWEIIHCVPLPRTTDSFVVSVPQILILDLNGLNHPIYNVCNYKVSSLSGVDTKYMQNGSRIVSSFHKYASNVITWYYVSFSGVCLSRHFLCSRQQTTCKVLSVWGQLIIFFSIFIFYV